MPKFYEDKELKRLQSMEMGILKDFMKICDENGFCLLYTSDAADEL